MTEIGICHPSDTVDSDHCHHTALPHRTCHRFLGACLAEDDHQRSRRDHDYLDDLVHLQALQIGQFWQEDSEGYDMDECAEEDEDAGLRGCRDRAIEGRGGITVDIGTLFGVGYLGLEDRILIEVQTAFVDAAAAAIRPQIHAGIVIINTCGMVIGKP